MNRDLTNRMADLLTRGWALTVSAGAPVLLLAIVVNATALALIDALLLGPGELLKTFAVGLGMGLAAYVIAPLVALIGWPIRGEFRMRPLFCATLFGGTVQYLISHVLLPLGFVPTLGPVFQFLILVVTIGSTLVTSGAFWMTLLPHRLVGRIAWIAVVVALGTGVREYVTQLAAGRSAVLQAVFEEAEPRVVRLLEPQRAPAAALADEFKAMEQDFARPSYAK